MLGEDISLSVAIQYNRSVASVVWEHEGSILDVSDNRVSIHTTPTIPASTGVPILSTLSIQSTMHEDAGMYTCTAINVDGNSTASFMVTIEGKYTNDIKQIA